MCPPLTIRILIANSSRRWRGIFKELLQDGGRADFSKNLRASLLNKYLTNEPSFSWIHLAGQYLKIFQNKGIMVLSTLTRLDLKRKIIREKNISGLYIVNHP
jgi:hypothetical protein